jgi:hypothetical protein
LGPFESLWDRCGPLRLSKRADGMTLAEELDPPCSLDPFRVRASDLPRGTNEVPDAGSWLRKVGEGAQPTRHSLVGAGVAATLRVAPSSSASVP